MNTSIDRTFHDTVLLQPLSFLMVTLESSLFLSLVTIRGQLKDPQQYPDQLN